MNCAVHGSDIARDYRSLGQIMPNYHWGTSKNLLNAGLRLLRIKLAAARCPIAASRARLRAAGASPRLAYLLDMSRCSLNTKLA
jgi:hypothetical protein